MCGMVSWDVWLTVVCMGLSLLSIPFLILSICSCKCKFTVMYMWLLSGAIIAMLWHTIGDNWRTRGLFWGNFDTAQQNSFSAWTSTWVTPQYTMLLFPTSELELRNIIADPATKKPIRFMGSGHSWSATGYSDGTLIDMRNFNRIVLFDLFENNYNLEIKTMQKHLPLPTRPAGQITVQAGVKVQDVVQFLAQRGFCIYGVGSIRAQSIGGVVSHGVHGPHPDGFNRHVLGMRVLFANGTFANVKDMFMWRSSMGMLGAIIEITIEFFPQILLDMENSPISTWHDLDSLGTHLHSWTSTTFTAFLYPTHCGSVGWKRVGRFHSFANHTNMYELDNQTNFADQLMLHFNNHMHPAMQYMYAGFGSILACTEQILADRQMSTLLRSTSKDILQNDGLIPQFYEIIDYEYMIPLKHCKTFAVELLQYQMYGRVLIPVCLRLLRREDSCMTMAEEDSCVFAIQSMRGMTHTIDWVALEKRVAALRGKSHFGKVSATSFQYYTYACLDNFIKYRSILDPDEIFMNPTLKTMTTKIDAKNKYESNADVSEFPPVFEARNHSTQNNILFGILSWMILLVAISISLWSLIKESKYQYTNPENASRISNKKEYILLKTGFHSDTRNIFKE